MTLTRRLKCNKAARARRRRRRQASLLLYPIGSDACLSRDGSVGRRRRSVVGSGECVLVSAIVCVCGRCPVRAGCGGGGRRVWSGRLCLCLECL